MHGIVSDTPTVKHVHEFHWDPENAIITRRICIGCGEGGGEDDVVGRCKSQLIDGSGQCKRGMDPDSKRFCFAHFQRTHGTDKVDGHENHYVPVDATHTQLVCLCGHESEMFLRCRGLLSDGSGQCRSKVRLPTEEYCSNHSRPKRLSWVKHKEQYPDVPHINTYEGLDAETTRTLCSCGNYEGEIEDRCQSTLLGTTGQCRMRRAKDSTEFCTNHLKYQEYSVHETQSGHRAVFRYEVDPSNENQILGRCEVCKELLATSKRCEGTARTTSKRCMARCLANNSTCAMHSQKWESKR